MIYVRHITYPQVLFVPKSGREVSGQLELSLRSTIDLDIKADEVVDIKTSALYYNIAIELPSDAPCGEYEYTLTDGNGVLSSGLLTICEDKMTTEARQYEKTMTYEQYEAE